MTRALSQIRRWSRYFDIHWWLVFLCACLPLAYLATVEGQGAPGYETALKPGETIVTTVGAQSATTVALKIDRSEIVQVAIDQDEPTLLFRALSPDGECLREVRSGYPGTMLFSFKAAEAGLYHLAIQADAGLATSVQVTLRLEARPVTNPERSSLQAEQLFSEAQGLRSQPDSPSLQQAIVDYRRAGALWRSQKNEEGQFLALTAEAATLLELSRYAESLHAYSAAEALATKNPKWEITLLNGQAQVYLDWWKSDDALRFAEEALQLSRASHDSAGEAAALSNRGEALYLQSDTDRALSDLNDALSIARSEHRRTTLAHALRAEAWVEEDRGHLKQAAILMREAEQGFRETGDLRASLDAMSSLATINAMSGDLYSALIHHAKVSQLLEVSGELSSAGFAIEAMGTDYDSMNRTRSAVEYFHRAYQIFVQIQHTSGEQTAVDELCVAELKLKLLQDAFAHCQQSARLSLLVHDSKREAIAQLHLGEVSESLKKPHDAFAYYDNAAKLSHEVNDPRFEALSITNMGRLKEESREYANARTLYERALQLSTSAEDLEGIIGARYHIANSAVEMGQTAEAMSQLDMALKMIEVQRIHVRDDELRTSYFTSVRKCYDLYVDILMRLHEAKPTARFDLLALEKSEAGRVRTLLDAVSGEHSLHQENRDTTAAQNAEKLHSALNQAYENRLNLMLHHGKEIDLQHNAAEIRRLDDAYGRTMDTLEEKPLEDAPSFQPLRSQELLQKSMNSGLVILEYYLGEKRSYVWKLDRGTLSSYVLPGRDDISLKVERWRALVLARQRRESESLPEYLSRIQAVDRDLSIESSQLSCILLGALHGSDTGRLAIVADGILQSLPFSALQVDGCNRTNDVPLISSFELTDLPSISLLAARRSDKKTNSQFSGDVAVLADPVFSADDPRVQGWQTASLAGVAAPQRQMALRDAGYGGPLPRLIATRGEGKAIASAVPNAKVFLALDFDASLQTALSETLSHYRIWHFATHGLLDAKSPELSGLVLSLVDHAGHPVSGYLKIQDISSLSLHNDLVVLSACDSGMGEQADGEGTVGLAYAFLHAGSKSVLSTLWSVDDDASSELMAEFYRLMLNAGKSPPEALRGAQVKLLHQRRTASPIYWAGYVLTGDPR